MLTPLQQYHIEDERWQYHFEEYLHQLFCKAALEAEVRHFEAKYLNATDLIKHQKLKSVLAEVVRRADEHMAGAARAKENIEMLRKKIPVGDLKNELN